MYEATYELLASQVTDAWLPPDLGECIAGYASPLVALSSALRDEFFVHEDDSIASDPDGAIQRAILHALCAGHAWAMAATRTPLYLEEDVIQSILRVLQPIVDPGDPCDGVPQADLALHVLRDLSDVWHEAMSIDDAADVLDDRTALIAEIDPADAREQDLGTWFDTGAAHAQFQRIVEARAVADDRPWDFPSLNPVDWVIVLCPEIMTGTRRGHAHPSAHR